MGLSIKKGDKIIVLAGKDKGKTGKVLKAIPRKSSKAKIKPSKGGFKAVRRGRVIVEGVNLVKKHMRRRSESEPGGIKELPLSLDLSNVALFCGNCNKGVRFSVTVSKDKSKARICKKCKRPL